MPTPIGYEPIPGLKIKVKAYDQVAKLYLDRAEEIFKASDGLDTAVRDSVAEGLAFIVHAAYDSQACSVNLDSESFHDFIAKKTSQWFASRDFVDWFCQGAACLFNSSQREVFHTLMLKGKGVTRMKRVKVA